MLYHLFFYVTVVIATLNTSRQAVMENELFIENCVELSHTNLQRNITLIVVTQPDTATGNLSSYVHLHNTI